VFSETKTNLVLILTVSISCRAFSIKTLTHTHTHTRTCTRTVTKGLHNYNGCNLQPLCNEAAMSASCYNCIYFVVWAQQHGRFNCQVWIHKASKAGIIIISCIYTRNTYLVICSLFVLYRIYYVYVQQFGISTGTKNLIYEYKYEKCCKKLRW